MPVQPGRLVDEAFQLDVTFCLRDEKDQGRRYYDRHQNDYRKYGVRQVGITEALNGPVHLQDAATAQLNTPEQANGREHQHDVAVDQDEPHHPDEGHVTRTSRQEERCSRVRSSNSHRNEDHQENEWLNQEDGGNL